MEPVYKWRLLSILAIGSFMSSLDGSIVTIALPRIAIELGVSFDQIQWVPIIYLLAMAITLVGFGRLGDLHGRKLLFLWGIAIFTISSLLDSLSTSGTMLVVFRGIQGIGASLVAAESTAMITAEFPPRERGRALGINVAAIYLGLVAGPVLGGVLVQFLDWRSIFYINLPIGVAISYFAAKDIQKRVPDDVNVKFDQKGMLFFGAFLASLLLGLSLGYAIGWGSVVVLGLLVASAACCCVFIFVETRAPRPMINLSLFRRNRLFAWANITALLNYCALNGVTFLLSIYLQTILGYSPLVTGLIIAPSPIAMAIISPFSGRLSDRIGTRALSSAGMLIIGSAILFLAFVLMALPVQFILVSQAILGTGSGLFSSPNQSAIMGSVDRKDLGIASGTLATMRVMGQSMSVAVLSTVVGLFIPAAILNPILEQAIGVTVTISVQHLFMHGFLASLMLSAILCYAGSLSAMMRGTETRSSLQWEHSVHVPEEE
jgi:EmrB/QacA subfamily drug resistance transporter